MRLKSLIILLAALLPGFLSGCFPGAPSSRIPGRYHFSSHSYDVILELDKGGVSKETRRSPDGTTQSLLGKWRIGPLDGHITIEPILPFYSEAGVDLSKPSFYTPDVEIVWGKVCLLVDGNKDLYMCKQG